MSWHVDWTYLAWQDVTTLRWRTAGNVCRAVYDLATSGAGTLRRLRPGDQVGATHALLAPPFMVFVSIDEQDRVLRAGGFVATCAELRR